MDRERDRDRDRQTDRQTDKQRQRQRLTDRQRQRLPVSLVSIVLHTGKLKLLRYLCRV